MSEIAADCHAQVSYPETRCTGKSCAGATTQFRYESAMFAFLIALAILLVCTVIVIIWMSRAPQIEEEEKDDSHNSLRTVRNPFPAQDLVLHQRTEHFSAVRAKRYFPV
ncbi:hypothetical protein SH139x_000217 [Planctomycetaceae bacterium SH139]